jgi:hypothetical protein
MNMHCSETTTLLYLGEATRSTAYAASIKPFQRRKDGRLAWLALLGQYAGNDKWEAEIKIQEASYTPEFGRVNATSRSNPLSPSTGTPTVSMEACAEHAQYQFPNQHSIVGFLLDAIQNNDAGLQAAIASVRTCDLE